MIKPIPFLYWNDSSKTAHEKWKKIMRRNLKASKTFEIHCWKDEIEEIQLALAFGSIKNTSWTFGTVIEGDVTPNFTDFLLSLPKPIDTEIVDKMTPFFSIFLDNGFSSEHYGTELYKL
ncbi:MAG: hypothetical protein KHZ62_11130 [Clostridiales bacterium]|nr:hypothetical protein [Clostridiales bacterium]